MKVLVSDTSVLIDLERAGMLEAAFELSYQFTVPDLLYREEIDPHPDLRRSLLTWGLEISELGGDGVGKAQALRLQQPKISAPDAFALVLALERGWILLTGDQDLRNLAKKEGVRPHGVLWVLDRIAESHGVDTRGLFQALTTLARHPRCRLPRLEVEKRLKRWRR